MKSRMAWLCGALLVVAIPVLCGCSGSTTTVTETTTQQVTTTITAEAPAGGGGPPSGGNAPSGGGPAATSTATTTLAPAAETGESILLPSPVLTGTMSVEEALSSRRSVRQFADTPITLEKLSQLLWAAQGITSEDGKRTAPSAMKSYPLTIYVAAYNVTGLAAGVYKYVPDGHTLVQIREGDVKTNMSSSYNGAADIIIVDDFTILTAKAGDIGERFAILEAGHAAQNVYLEAAALDLGTVTTAGFQEASIRDVLGLTDNLTIIYVMPVGNIP